MHNWIKVIGEVGHSDEYSYVLSDYFYCDKCMRCMRADDDTTMDLSCEELQIENLLDE